MAVRYNWTAALTSQPQGALKVLNGGELELNSATMTGSNLTIDSSGILDINSGIALSGNFLYSITNEADAVWGGTSFLKMNGFDSFLELGGQDFGTDPANHVGAAAGFSLNFDLTELIIGSGAKLHLADFFDNANRVNHGFGTAEARGKRPDTRRKTKRNKCLVQSARLGFVSIADINALEEILKREE